MSAYKIEINKSICATCHAYAKYEVFNRYNAPCGYYCRGCADTQIKNLNRGEPT